jgi:GT2 family glycosyltransferase
MASITEPGAPLHPLALKVGIATANRRETLADTLEQLAHQQRLPDEVIVCPSRPEDCDLDRLVGLPFATRVVHGPRGLSAQRNAILSQLGACDAVLFLDDDFYASSDYIARLEMLFIQEPRVVGITGNVVVDGAISEAVEHAAALDILRAIVPTSSSRVTFDDVYSLYGCNMAVRLAPIQSHALRFDENLPLYGWLEDVDFTRQLASHGQLVKSMELTGVHLATKRGRSSGVPLGYSQVANPWYLMRKGTMEPKRALRQLSRNVAANFWRCFAPEPWVDRRGRLRGNAMAAMDLMCGRLDPRKIVAI